ncbi:MAG TPA: UDP-N-acetylmuramyl-tripeptide synthetase [Lacipirellulaceae bacterium]|nr:UDP-N-acetylmuramyl-tripeptide synthetase [Lacipirellulaceae bacterium]
MVPASFHAAGVPLRQLLAGDIQGDCPHDLRASSCTSDGRQVQKGDVFVALVEADRDGHEDAFEAAQRGAAAIICERPVPVFDVPQCIVADSRAAYGRLCQALVGNPSRQLKVIGVTGTHGKTTVARLLSSIFRRVGASFGALDSFGYMDGCDDYPTTDARLTPPALARSLAEMVAAGATHAVVELSSRELSAQVPAGVTLDAVCLTQVGRKNLEWHGSLENYRLAKRRVFDYLQPGGIAIMNADDPVSMGILGNLDFASLTYGLREYAEIVAEIVEQRINEQTFVITAGDESVGVRTPIIGDHHVSNCLAATAVALAYGVKLSDVARGLEAVDQLPGRMERIMCGQDFAVLVDAANSADALRVCLRAARRATSGRLLCVFGTQDNFDEGQLRATGRVIGAMSDAAVITTSGRIDGNHRACIAIHSGLADRRKARVILDRNEAIAWALSEAKTGDTVLVAGMGERPHAPCDAVKTLIADGEVIRQLLIDNSMIEARHRLAA